MSIGKLIEFWTGAGFPLKIALVLLPLLLLLAAFLGFRWWRKRKAPSQPEDKPNKSDKPLTRRTLLSIWKRFLIELPWRYHEAVMTCPGVVVIGPPGAGKSTLIDTQVDWRGQSSQFLPSLTDESLLQIYLGSEVVVQELSSTLLEDGSKQARKALLALWRHSFARRDPAIVVVLDVRMLATLTPDELRRYAQLARGKINLLSELRQRPIKARLCFTHMDQVPGYSDFARLLSQHHVPLGSEFATGKSISGGLLGYTQYLPLALTSLPVDAFERVVQFLARIQELLAPADPLVEALLGDTALSLAPAGDRLFLFSPVVEEQTANLFHGVEGAASSGVLPPSRLHLYRCAAAFLLGFLPLTGIYLYHSSRLLDAQAAIQSLEREVRTATGPAAIKSPAESVEVKEALIESQRAIKALNSSERIWPLLSSSSRTYKSKLRERLTTAVRNAYLIPAVVQCGAHCERQPVLYTLGLIYAARDSELGRIITPQTNLWSDILKIPEIVVQTYLDNSEVPYRDRVTVSLLPPTQEENTPITRFGHWQTYLSRLDRVFEQARMTNSELAELQATSEELFTALEDARRFAAAERVFQLLSREAPIDMVALFGQGMKYLETAQWIRQNQKPLGQLLDQVRNTDQDFSKAAKFTLPQLVSRLKTLLGETGASTERFALDLKGIHFVHDPQRWGGMFTRSYIAAFKEGSRYVFLPPDWSCNARAARRTEDIPSDDDEVDEPKSDCQEIFTKEVFIQTAKPTLMEFTKQLDDLKASPRDRDELVSLVMGAVKGYAERYRMTLSNIFETIEFPAHSPEQLPEVLAEMGQPNSSLFEGLRIVSTNVDLGPLDGSFLRPMQEELEVFQPFMRLMTAGKDGSYPELLPYTTIMSQMARELDTGPGASAGGGQLGGQNLGLMDLLSPTGRVTLPMLLEQDNSYRRQVEKWLEKEGIVGRWRRPFLEPIERVIELGTADIRHTLQEQWRMEAKRTIMPLLERYPFDRRAQNEVDPRELDVLRMPDGAFWQFFNRVVAPLCVDNNGTWTVRRQVLQQFETLPVILAAANRISQISRVLWNKDGQPQPLPLEFKALPLTNDLRDGNFIILSYLRTGRLTVYGFNQRPEWQQLQLTWWDQGTSTVGYQIGSPSGHRDPQSIDETSAWSFFRLLDRAKVLPENIAVWTLGGGVQREREIRFSLRGEPWSSFYLPRP